MRREPGDRIRSLRLDVTLRLAGQWTPIRQYIRKQYLLVNIRVPYNGFP
jgi:hypothetical protein